MVRIMSHIEKSFPIQVNFSLSLFMIIGITKMTACIQPYNGTICKYYPLGSSIGHSNLFCSTSQLLRRSLPKVLPGKKCTPCNYDQTGPNSGTAHPFPHPD